jgi:hypothetical protein
MVLSCWVHTRQAESIRTLTTSPDTKWLSIFARR